MKEHVLNQKKAVVDEIKGHINDAKSMVIVDYRGLDVSEATELREKFRNENVLFKVYKNTMMNFAFKELGFDGFLDYLSGPNAVAFSMDDPIAAARIAKEFAADHENLEIKAGYLGDKFLDVEGVKKIASIPSREVLLTKMLGSFKAPVSKFVYLADAIAK
ncbi:50S ribosomal protein L10 [Finegoldia sp. P3-F-LR]